VGKIAFLSDRAGGDESLVYVIDPDSSNLALLTDRWPYDLARERDAYSVDLRFRVFVRDAVHWDNGVAMMLPALYFRDYFYQVEEQITHFGGGIAYDPSWSPTSEQIVFVSDDSKNDEIWVINRDGSGAVQLTRNQWEWDKHPSWSPDGGQVVFYSNRTGTNQIWIMSKDGSEQRLLMDLNPYNDWNPVWIKYTDPPRDPISVE
jgi:TolB protein